MENRGALSIRQQAHAGPRASVNPGDYELIGRRDYVRRSVANITIERKEIRLESATPDRNFTSGYSRRGVTSTIKGRFDDIGYELCHRPDEVTSGRRGPCRRCGAAPLPARGSGREARIDTTCARKYDY